MISLPYFYVQIEANTTLLRFEQEPTFDWLQERHL